MDIKEYIVSLNKDVDYDEFWAEMENPTNGLTFVPDRRIDIINERPASLRQCHYALTDTEAKKLQEDPRVNSVDIPFNQRSDLKMVKHLTQVGNFAKTAESFGNYQNWGLKRSIADYNNFGEENTAPGNYDYVLDGEGVDVVVMDSGISASHLEFIDSDGSFRVQLIDWYDEVGLSTNVQLDLSTSVASSVSTNSYINFQHAIQTFLGYIEPLLGASLVLGPKARLPGTNFDPAMHQLFMGQENLGRAYRIRYEGRVSQQDNPEITSLIWEVKFTDANMIEILVLRHDDATNGLWLINSRTETKQLSIFQSPTLVQGVQPRSCVLTTNDNGETWTIYGDNNTDYHLTLDEGIWTINPGVATEIPVTGLISYVFNNDIDENLYYFNTPFPFYTGTGSNSPQSPLHYVDTDGHGTHVAGILAGNTFGWAKKANIYSMKILGLEGPFDQGTGLFLLDAFDILKLWHQQKPINPKTGYKRPTIVNMSWGFFAEYLNDIVGGTYRGVPWLGNEMVPEYGMIGTVHGARAFHIDNDVQELIDEGIHVIISAGNYSHKTDILGGVDYDNYYTSASFGNIGYHQGSSPYSSEAITVGSIDSSSYDANTDRKAFYSDTGPGVDIYAPGTNIVSCTSFYNFEYGVQYWPSRNLPFGNIFLQSNLSGTSMAAPQVSGVAALLLQLRPNLTPAQLKEYILNSASDDLYSTGLDDDYIDFLSLLGGNDRILYYKFGVPKSFNLNIGK